MDATNRREVVVGEWTLNITASPDGAGLQVEALRRTPELDAAVIQGKGASPPEEGRVAVCVADVEGHLEPATVILPANKVPPSPPLPQWPHPDQSRNFLIQPFCLSV
jgi:hypothetical protein